MNTKHLYTLKWLNGLEIGEIDSEGLIHRDRNAIAFLRQRLYQDLHYQFRVPYDTPPSSDVTRIHNDLNLLETLDEQEFSPIDEEKSLICHSPKLTHAERRAIAYIRQRAIKHLCLGIKSYHDRPRLVQQSKDHLKKDQEVSEGPVLVIDAPDFDENVPF